MIIGTTLFLFGKSNIIFLHEVATFKSCMLLTSAPTQDFCFHAELLIIVVFLKIYDGKFPHKVYNFNSKRLYRNTRTEWNEGKRPDTCLIYSAILILVS